MVTNTLRVAVLGSLLGGCGMVQSVTDSTASAAHAVFYKQVKTLHLDFEGRLALNTDSADMKGLSVPTLVRVYQLRDGKVLANASYNDIVSGADRMLDKDLLSERSVVVKPGEGLQLNMPLDEAAQVVAVVGLFRDPDLHSNSWRLTLAREALEPDRPRVVELGGNRLVLRPLAED
jgi:type VI secretion system protein VasD